MLSKSEFAHITSQEEVKSFDFDNILEFIVHLYDIRHASSARAGIAENRCAQAKSCLFKSKNGMEY